MHGKKRSLLFTQFLSVAIIGPPTFTSLTLWVRFGTLYHYIYVDKSHADNAPTSCSVSQSRDCPDNQCICQWHSYKELLLGTNLVLVGAIANYTTRVADTHLSAVQRQEALKFLGSHTTSLSTATELTTIFPYQKTMCVVPQSFTI